MIDWKKGDVLVVDGYDGDEDVRTVVADKDPWASKAGKTFLTARDVSRNVFRSYNVEKIRRLVRSKT